MNTDYKTVIENLFSLLAIANASDSRAAATWQRSEDATGYYKHIHSAIEAIAGAEILNHWVESGEVALSLANRAER